MITGNRKINWRINYCLEYNPLFIVWKLLWSQSQKLMQSSQGPGKGASHWHECCCCSTDFAAPGEANSSRIRPIIFAFSPVCLDTHRPSSVTCGLWGTVNPTPWAGLKDLANGEFTVRAKCIFNHQDMLIVRKGQAALLSLQGRGSVERDFSFVQLISKVWKVSFLAEACCSIKIGS